MVGCCATRCGQVPGGHPLGGYYLYFAHHKGGFIRLAYANALTGPWKIYESGVLDVKDMAFYNQLKPETLPQALE